MAIGAAIIGALGALGAGAMSLFGQKKAQQTTQQATQTAKETADSNLALQKEQLEYQKGLQQQIFMREDTAQQRAAADLSAAGLSKTLAAGSGAGAGAVVSTQAPQRDATAEISAQLEMARSQQEMYINAINMAMSLQQQMFSQKMETRTQDREDKLAGNTIQDTHFKQTLSTKEYEELVSKNEREFKHLENQLKQARSIADADRMVREAAMEWEKKKWNSELAQRERIADTQMKEYLVDEFKNWMWYQNEKFGITADMPTVMKEWMMAQKAAENQFIYNSAGKAMDMLPSGGGIFNSLFSSTRKRK